jgi:hypothetical protein
MSKRVVVTGMSLASPLGSTINSSFDRLHVYENCVNYDELPYVSLLRTLLLNVSTKKY